jgi:hypothetical protein
MKPGPKPDSKWGSKIVEGKLVGRNNIVVPPEEVEDLASLGCTDRDIANWFGVDENTLRYNFSDHLLKGRENLKISLRRAMLKNACVNLNAAVQIFLAKNMLGMSDNGLVNDGSKVLPFTDDEDLKPTEEQLADMKEEYAELNGIK